MDDRKHEEGFDELADPPRELPPLEAAEVPTLSEDDAAIPEVAVGTDRFQVEIQRPENLRDPLASELERLEAAEPFESETQLEPFFREEPRSPQEIVFGTPAPPGPLNIDFQPHARKLPIIYEPRLTIESPEDVPSGILRGPHRPDARPGDVRDLVMRDSDPDVGPKIKLMRDATAGGPPTVAASTRSEAGDDSAASSERGEGLPRILVTVSMANARSIFQECLERASQTLGAKFQSACQSTVNTFAIERKASERASRRW